MEDGRDGQREIEQRWACVCACVCCEGLGGGACMGGAGHRVVCKGMGVGGWERETRQCVHACVLCVMSMEVCACMGVHTWARTHVLETTAE